MRTKKIALQYLLAEESKGDAGGLAGSRDALRD